MSSEYTYRRSVAVTPSDATDLPEIASTALLVTVTGNLSVVMEKGGQIDLLSVAANTLLPLRVAQVRATGTTATVVALY